MPPEPLPNTRFPVRVWGRIGEPQAEQQLRNIATLPILFHHVAVMPDVHWGMGATVGTVTASESAVIPAAVGVDIGCGMCAVRLPMDRQALQAEDRLGRLRRAIEGAVPLGFAQYPPERVSEQARAWAAHHLRPGCLRAPIGRELLEKARLQIGTLGGGNHFIEVSVDEADRGWILLHSGSRHIGKRIADHYIKTAKARMAQNRISLPDADLAYFEQGRPGFEEYLADLHWAQDYARFNRDEIMRRVLAEVVRLYPGAEAIAGEHPPILERVDCHHNYVSRERHFGKLVYVTRKGAVSARKGEMGIIPGSMGARSYIVEGKGCAESFHSCAHGAGRAMSRKEAKRRFTLADLARQTEGIECRKDKGVLDEIPSAYKDIDAVMAAQEDLITVRHTLKQLICVKG